MTLRDIKEAVMFQTDNDRNDLGDFMPFLMAYINEGYDRLLYVWNQNHIKMDTEYPPLVQDSDIPKIPIWAHNAIVDWATYMIYRNGNGAKQNRGMAYLQQYNSTRGRLIDDKATGRNIIHIPV